MVYLIAYLLVFIIALPIGVGTLIGKFSTNAWRWILLPPWFGWGYGWIPASQHFFFLYQFSSVILVSTVIFFRTRENRQAERPNQIVHFADMIVLTIGVVVLSIIYEPPSF